jgi:hypothetical protein
LNLRRILPYTTFALVLVAVYTGWTFYSRYSAGQEAEEKSRESEARRDQKTVDRFGGGELKILSFYITPVTAAAGERVLVCYSVVNATEVDITPEIEPVKPSISRCLEVHPKRSTIYTLKARDAVGAEVSQTAAVEIR